MALDYSVLYNSCITLFLYPYTCILTRQFSIIQTIIYDSIHIFKKGREEYHNSREVKKKNRLQKVRLIDQQEKKNLI